MHCDTAGGETTTRPAYVAADASDDGETHGDHTAGI
jgi:hypothetical protein